MQKVDLVTGRHEKLFLSEFIEYILFCWAMSLNMVVLVIMFKLLWFLVNSGRLATFFDKPEVIVSVYRHQFQLNYLVC